MTLSLYPKSKNIWLIISLVLAPIIILLLGILLFPDIFYDQFIWRYFWGPIVEDALNKPVSYHGVIPAEKFTLVSELIYGLLVLSALLGLYRLLKRWALPVDSSFLFSIVPYIIYGSVARVLEDAQLFTEPLVYWFVTPLIYFQSLLLFLVLLFIGHILEKRKIHPYITKKTILFIGGLGCLIPTIYYVVVWMLGHQWSATYGVRIDVLLLVVGLVLLTVIPVYLLGRYMKPKERFKAYADPMNLSMLFGHMLDGFGTYISIYDPLQMGLPLYYEKHPASDFLLQLWPPLFPIVKFLLIIVIIYVFDVLYKEEMRNYPLLANLLKIGIFILGFAPGLRSVLRVCMGV